MGAPGYYPVAWLVDYGQVRAQNTDGMISSISVIVYHRLHFQMHQYSLSACSAYGSGVLRRKQVLEDTAAKFGQFTTLISGNDQMYGAMPTAFGHYEDMASVNPQELREGWKQDFKDIQTVSVWRAQLRRPLPADYLVHSSRMFPWQPSAATLVLSPRPFLKLHSVKFGLQVF